VKPSKTSFLEMDESLLEMDESVVANGYPCQLQRVIRLISFKER